jgi:hypothetical protein
MYIFKQTETQNVYNYVRPVTQGLGPSISEVIKSKARDENALESEFFRWAMHASDLISECVKRHKLPEGQNYVLVADIHDALKKSGRRQLLLLDVLRIFGVSGYGWTPMLWMLCPVLNWWDLSDKERKDKFFKMKNENQWTFEPTNEIVSEHLRLNSDHKGGRRALGIVGQLNGVLIFPEAEDYFDDMKRKFRREFAQGVA